MRCVSLKSDMPVDGPAVGCAGREGCSQVYLAHGDTDNASGALAEEQPMVSGCHPVSFSKLTRSL